jgi:FMN-dependent NADH-azoreductase
MTDKKWIYRISIKGGTTFEYDKDSVISIDEGKRSLTIIMKSGAYFAHNWKYVINWRLIEV